MTITVNGETFNCTVNGQPQSARTSADQTMRDLAAIIRTCPVDGANLVEVRCKLVCKTCGYYLGCSDYL